MKLTIYKTKDLQVDLDQENNTVYVITTDEQQEPYKVFTYVQEEKTAQLQLFPNYSEVDYYLLCENSMFTGFDPEFILYTRFPNIKEELLDDYFLYLYEQFNHINHEKFPTILPRKLQKKYE